MWKRIVVMVLLALIPVSNASATQDTVTERYISELRALLSYLERELNVVSTESLSADAMRQVIAEGSAWLSRAQEANGHFRYEYAPYEDRYLDDDNIVRQAGALYQLGEIIRHDTNDTLGLVTTIESAIEYFRDLSMKDTYKGTEFRCIIRFEGNDTCKLGATSLALIGMLSYVEAYPEKLDEYAVLIADYIAYIKASKIEGEGFRNKHILGNEFQSEKESSFSNGEALLALTRYYQYDQDPEVAKLALDTFSYLETTSFDSPLYLWVMAALKDMRMIWPSNAYNPYASAYTNWRIADRSRFRDTRNNYCALAEGIVSAYSVLKHTMKEPEREALRREIDFWNNKHLRLYIGEDDAVRYVWKDHELQRYEIKDMDTAHGGFLTSDTVLTQRIDFTQHCLNAYLQVLTDIAGEELSV